MIKSMTVSEFVSEIRNTVRQSPSLKNVALVGEISNFNPHHSGHFYFTLKDEGSRIDCVMFSSHTKTLLFKPKNGDKIIVQGYADVYVAAGKVQFYAQKMELEGLGALHIKYEALKKQFYEEGLFDVALKKPLPKFPRKIAIITGKDSAAYADMHKTLQSRWPFAQRLVYFTYVQGEFAVPTVKNALMQAELANVDVILLARGGGSIEDLWAFNEAPLVRQIALMKTPVICAIGHESDTTLCELAADYRAATPTDAAVVASPHQNDVQQNLRDYKNMFYLKTVRNLERQQRQYQTILNSGYLKDPSVFFSLKQLDLDYLTQIYHQKTSELKKMRDSLSQLDQKMLQMMNRKISQSQALLQQRNYQKESAIKAKIHQQNQRLQAQLIDQKSVLNYTHSLNTEITLMTQKSIAAITQRLKLKQQNFSGLIQTIDAKSPLKKMQQGYLYATKDGKTISSIDDLEQGDLFNLRAIDGIIKVEMIEKEANNGKF